uniref:SJCHGC01179 protein n=1 Tax=Schistosoma japonicum TaxID=6182 RepID=Q5DHY7_SCHJA|nr:SJCHGC01179 protein [Schistosoma japonicum]
MDKYSASGINKPMVCGLCSKTSSYICPRCGINYCSLTCYRHIKHKDCSESFYKDCCIESLRCTFSKQSERLRMIEVLKLESCASDNSESLCMKLEVDGQQISDEDENSDDDLQSRLRDLNLENEDAEVIWSRLTLKEKRDFNRFIQSNAIVHFIPTWTPWWLEEKPIIVEMDEHSKSVKKSYISPTVQSLSKLLPSGISPHPSVGFILADVLLGYVFVMRFYNGDYMDLIDDAGALLCNLILSFTQSWTPSSLLNNTLTSSNNTSSDYLKKTRIVNKKNENNSTHQIYNCINDILAGIQYRLMELNLPCHASIMILLLEDLSHLLENTTYCNKALQEVHQLINQFRKALRTNVVSANEGLRIKAKFVHHKLVFLQACLEEKNQVAKRWQTNVLPKLWSQISTELIQRIHDLENSPTDRHGGKSAGPNWRNIIRDENIHKGVCHTLAESTNINGCIL